MELNISTEIVCHVITFAREFQAQEAVVFPGDINQLSETDPSQVLAAHANDLTYLNLTEEIGKLEPDQKITLMALLYLGRGDFTLAEWDECLKQADYDYINDAQFIVHLLAIPQVSDFLESALTSFGYSCE